jgi:hypothetical protein
MDRDGILIIMGYKSILVWKLHFLYKRGIFANIFIKKLFFNENIMLFLTVH